MPFACVVPCRTTKKLCPPSCRCSEINCRTRKCTWRCEV